jgi:predicted nucleic acid-binding protein
LNLAIIDRLFLLRRQFELIQLGLNITGVVGVLLRGWREGELPSVSEAIAQLRTFAGFHIAPAFLAEVLRETGEIEP